jgi:hypothetical protein
MMGCRELSTSEILTFTHALRLHQAAGRQEKVHARQNNPPSIKSSQSGRAIIAVQPIEQPCCRPAVPAATARCLNLPPRQLIGDLLDGHVAKLDQDRPRRFRVTVGLTLVRHRD